MRICVALRKNDRALKLCASKMEASKKALVLAQAVSGQETPNWMWLFKDDYFSKFVQRYVCCLICLSCKVYRRCLLLCSHVCHCRTEVSTCRSGTH